jgi:GTPase Era involved in 16S rRNA processing
MAEISELQEDVYQNVFKFSTMSKEEQLNHVKTLEKLLEKQKVLYTRLSLSDDPEAVAMKEKISESALNDGTSPKCGYECDF